MKQLLSEGYDGRLFRRMGLTQIQHITIAYSRMQSRVKTKLRFLTYSWRGCGWHIPQQDQLFLLSHPCDSTGLTNTEFYFKLLFIQTPSKANQYQSYQLLVKCVYTRLEFIKEWDNSQSAEILLLKLCFSPILLSIELLVRIVYNVL